MGENRWVRRRGEGGVEKLSAEEQMRDSEEGDRGEAGR